MKNNKLSYLGLLGLLGLIGIPTGQYALFGFFGFFGFLSLLRTKNDELLQENVGKAATTGFVVSTIGLAITMALVATLETVAVAMIGIAVTFVAQMLAYTFTLSWYERA
ncbi:MAG TPA: DUF3796 domain-containing protein [Candidatus Paceibacterota bacterium]|nr:DUF3796 domain-containing protein [Candidatus Paceibacterota bacterium]